MLVNACQCFSRVVKYFAPQRGDAKDGRLLIFIPLVDWSVAPLVSGCHSFLECMSVIVKGVSRVAGLRNLLQPCSRAARKWRENEEIERRWRENEEMDRE